MSTAARPTFHAAKGRTSFGGLRSGIQSAKDQLAHTKLKFRQLGQSTGKDLKSNLDRNERIILESKGLITSSHKSENGNDEFTRPTSPIKLLKDEEVIDLNEVKKKYDDEDVDYERDSNDEFESR